MRHVLRHPRPETAGSPAPPPPQATRRWVADVYGSHVDALVAVLPALLARAAVEAGAARTPPSAEAIVDPTTTACGLLKAALTELRSVLLSVDVGEDDQVRDLRLRAALSAAIGSATGLALASSSQPTGGYLVDTRVAVNAVLIAAGRSSVA